MFCNVCVIRGTEVFSDPVFMLDGTTWCGPHWNERQNEAIRNLQMSEELRRESEETARRMMTDYLTERLPDD